MKHIKEQRDTIMLLNDYSVKAYTEFCKYTKEFDLLDELNAS